MENDNNSDQFLAMQALNSVPGNVMSLSPPSNTNSVHLQELTSAVTPSSSGTMLGKYSSV